jgi:hypothetical protein
MPHTEGRYMQDLGFTDAKVFAGAGDVVFTGGPPVLTRVPPGYFLAVPTAATTFIAVNAAQLLARRLGFFEDLQEQFGGAGIAGSAQSRTYRPDVIGAMSAAQQLQPRAAFKTKGFRLISVDVIYTITGAALTTNLIRIDSVQYVNNVAPANTVILASAANGLQTAVQAQPYVTTVTPAVQPYFTLQDGALWIDLAMTVAAGTATFFGFDVSFEINFN